MIFFGARSKKMKIEKMKIFDFFVNTLSFSFIDNESQHQQIFSDVICSFIGTIEMNYCLTAKKIDSYFSLEDLLKFTLDNLSNKSKVTCVAVSIIIKNLTFGLIKTDLDVLLQRNNEDNTGKNDAENLENNQWHILDTFRSTLETYQVVMSDFIEDFRYEI
jgi:hypothetical protein